MFEGGTEVQKMGLALWFSGWEPTCSCREHWFDPGLGGSHRPGSNQTRVSQLLSHTLELELQQPSPPTWGQRSTTRGHHDEKAAPRGRGQPCPPQLEERLRAQRLTPTEAPLQKHRRRRGGFSVHLPGCFQEAFLPVKCKKKKKKSHQQVQHVIYEV